MNASGVAKVGLMLMVASAVLWWGWSATDGQQDSSAVTTSAGGAETSPVASGPTDEKPPRADTPTTNPTAKEQAMDANTLVDSPMPGIATWTKALGQQLQAALAKRGKGYVARTHHKEKDGTPHFTNRLILESSPYLVQHAHNPVNWHPWGDEAFELARREKKPVFMSIGYATCHWCHVMEEESFEDLEIATYMNEHYICIKVDREERPDVDSIYMTAVQILTRSGGWPMSTWMTPDRMPFMAGTYFPPRDGARGSRRGFLTLLKELKEQYATDPAIATKAQELTQRVMQSMRPRPAESGLPTAAVLDRAIDQYWQRFDHANGGMRSGRKFPSSLPIRFLLRYARRTGDERALKMANNTLKAMYRGGLYDHVGSGFHRYTVDPRWDIPHFEKMLYDNALLAVAYAEAWQLTDDPEYRQVATEVLDYVAKEMTNPVGAFYSATDADSEGHEGKFFVWNVPEIQKLLQPDDARLLIRHYGASRRGNFEGHNHLQIEVELATAAQEQGWTLEQAKTRLEVARKTLYDTRAKRIPPLRDDKVLTDWNGLMISAYARVGQAFQNAGYIHRAVQAANFLLQNAKNKDGRLMHVYMDGRPYNVAMLEDYAFFITGLLDLHEATGQERWLSEAIRLQKELDTHHWDKAAGGFFLVADDHEDLLVREKPDYDGAIPTGNSYAALNLMRLATFTFKEHYRKAAEQTIRAFGTILNRGPTQMSLMLLAVDYLLDVPREVVLVAPTADASTSELLQSLGKTFLPNRAFTMVQEGASLNRRKALVPWVAEKVSLGGKTTAYVCEMGKCELPTSDAAVFIKQLSKVHRLHPNPPKP